MNKPQTDEKTPVIEDQIFCALKEKKFPIVAAREVEFDCALEVFEGLDGLEALEGLEGLAGLVPGTGAASLFVLTVATMIGEEVATGASTGVAVAIVVVPVVVVVTACVCDAGSPKGPPATV